MTDADATASPIDDAIDKAKRRLRDEVDRLREKYRRARQIRTAIAVVGLAAVIYLVFRR